MASAKNALRPCQYISTNLATKTQNTRSKNHAREERNARARKWPTQLYAVYGMITCRLCDASGPVDCKY